MQARTSPNRFARSLLASAVAALVVATAGVGSAHAAVPAGNLAGNGDAEFDTEGWTTSPGFVAERYGAENRPSVAVSESFGGGALMFAGGSEAEVSEASQDISVTDAAAEIDAGQVTAALSAYLGGIDDEGDYAQVIVSAQPADAGAPFTPFVSVGPVTAADRNNVTAFLLRSASAPVPAGTRRIRITITSTRLFGIYTDGYADNLSLVLSGPSVIPRSRGRVGGIKSPGRRVKGRVASTAPCKSGRTVTVKKGRKTLGSTKSSRSGSFNIKTKKHKKGKLTVKVRKRTTASTICAALTKKVPGRN